MSTERDKVESINQCLTLLEIENFRKRSAEIIASESLLDYAQRLIAFTRDKDEYHIGLSPRGSLAMMRAAKTWAFMAGRNHVVPEDLQTILPAVVEHRLRANMDEEGRTGASLVQRMLNEVDVLE